MEGCVKKSAYYEKVSKEFRETAETESAFRILELLATQGMTEEQADKTLKRAYALFRLDRRKSLYDTVHVNRETLDYLEVLETEKAIEHSGK